MANYGLFIQKRYHKPRRGQIQLKFSLFFALVDLDKGNFPLNFICDLPKDFRNTTYDELFPNRITALLLAKELLEKAKQEYFDLDVQKEIKHRLFWIEQHFTKPLKPTLEEINLEPIINQSVQNREIPNNIKISYCIDDHCRTIFTDVNMLKSVLDNLVTNAIQAMSNGGNLFVNVYKSNKNSIISVEDTGIGIPEEIKSKVFVPMFTTKANAQGFGLPVAERVTEALGGKITFESEIGKGTKFIVSLPCWNKDWILVFYGIQIVGNLGIQSFLSFRKYLANNDTSSLIRVSKVRFFPQFFLQILSLNVYSF